MSINDASEAKNFVKTWMNHRKVFDIEIAPTPSDLFFQFNGKSDIGIGFTVMQPKIWETCVLVIAEVKIGEPHLKILETMRSKDREEFMLNLTNVMISLPAPYAFDPTFERNGFPQGIQFAREICYDNLTEDRLSNCMIDVVRSVNYVVRLFLAELGEVHNEV